IPRTGSLDSPLEGEAGRWCLVCPPDGFPGGSHLFRRVPPRSELATSSWKAQRRLVLAVHEEDGSRVTRCGHTSCLRRWETTQLLLGAQVSCLGQPTIGPACRLFPVLCPGAPHW